MVVPTVFPLQDPGEETDGYRQYEVLINRPTENLGVSFAHEGSYLRVKNIAEDSVLSRWNQAASIPALLEGDEILSVNGKQGRWIAMEDEMRKSGELKLLVRKNISRASTGQTAESYLDRLPLVATQDQVNLQENHEFHLASITYRGTPVHAAACSKDDMILRHLIKQGADVNEECVGTHDKKDLNMTEWRFKPIHLAADRGLKSTLLALLEAKADPNSYVAKPDGEQQFTALCQVSRRGYAPCMKVLLEHGARTNLRHVDGQSILHIASSRGHSACVKLLVERQVDLGQENANGCTPLEVAMGSSFPNEDLYLLARPNIEDLLLVARDAPSTAAEMLQGSVNWNSSKLVELANKLPEKHAASAVLSPVGGSCSTVTSGSDGPGCAKTPRLKDPERSPSVEDLTELMGLCPRVASLLVEVLTKEPEAEYDYPLVRRSPIKTFDPGSRLLEYSDQRKWDKSNSAMCFGDRLFTKMDSKKRSECRKNQEITGTRSVDIRVLLVTNIMDFKFLDALVNLSTAEDMRIFQRPAMQALVEFMWREHVWPSYRANQVVDLVEMCVLCWVVGKPPQTDDSRRVAWTLLAAITLRYIWIEATQLYSSRKHPRNFSLAYFKDFRNYTDVVTIISLCVALISALPDLVIRHCELLAVVSLCRWIQLLCGIAQVAKVGYMVMPLFRSLYDVRGISMVVVFVFAGFLHAFMALQMPENTDPLNIVMLNAFRVLIVGDGDGIDYVLGLGADEPEGSFWTQCFLYCGALVFGVLIMNLFIAVHGAAYQSEAAAKTENYYRNWACVCHEFYLMPSWRPKEWGWTCFFSSTRPPVVPVTADASGVGGPDGAGGAGGAGGAPEEKKKGKDEKSEEATKSEMGKMVKRLQPYLPLVLWCLINLLGTLIWLGLLLLISMPAMVYICAALLAIQLVCSDMVLRRVMLKTEMKQQIFAQKSQEADKGMYLKWCSWTDDVRTQEDALRESEATLPRLHRKLEKFMSEQSDRLCEVESQLGRHQQLTTHTDEKAPHESELPVRLKWSLMRSKDEHRQAPYESELPVRLKWSLMRSKDEHRPCQAPHESELHSSTFLLPRRAQRLAEGYADVRETTMPSA